MNALAAYIVAAMVAMTGPASATITTTILQGESADFAFVSTLHTSSIWNDGAFFALPLPLADNNIMGNLAVQLFEGPTPGGAPFASFIYDFNSFADPFAYAIELGPAWIDGDGSFSLTALNADAVLGDIAVGRVDGGVAFYQQQVFTPLAVAAPEPSTLGLIGLGLLGLGAMARRRRYS